MTDSTIPFELRDDDATALARSFETCGVYEGLEALEEQVEYDDEKLCQTLWALQARGAIELASMHEAWDRLSNAPLAAPPELVAAMLSKVSTFEAEEEDYPSEDDYDDYDDDCEVDYDDDEDDDEDDADHEDDPDRFDKLRLLYDWPRPLDILATAAYQANPDAFTPWRAWPEPVRRGIAFSLVRLGVALTDEELELLRTDVARRELATDLSPLIRVRAGEGNEDIEDVEFLVLCEGSPERLRKPTAAYLEMVETLGGPEAWGHALLGVIQEKGYSIPPSEAAPALAIAPIDALPMIFKELDAPRLECIYHTLLTVRDDAWEDLLPVADALTELHWTDEADAVRACAVILAHRKGESVPPNFDEKFEAQGVCLRSQYRPKVRPDIGRDETIAALRILGADRARAIVRRRLDDEVWKICGIIPVLDAVPDWLELAEIALERLSPRLDEYSSAAFAWRPLGPDMLPLLAAAHDAQAPGEIRELLQQSILEIVAEIADHEVPDPQWDRFVSIVGHDTRRRFLNELARTLRRIVVKLPEDRARAVIERALDPEYPSFPRVFSLLQVRPIPDLLERAMVTVAANLDRVAEPTMAWVRDALHALEDKAHPAIRAAMESHGSPQLAKVFVEATRQHDLDTAMAGSKTSVRAETKVERVVRLAEAHKGRTDLIRVYLLETDWNAEVEPSVVGRQGTTPIGVDRSNWPRKEGTAPEDFELARHAHVFTLPLTQMPDLAAWYPGAEALAFFITSTDHHKAWAPGNGQTTLVPLSAEDLERGEPEQSRREAHPITITPVDVPAALFFRADPELEELSKALYLVSARVMGAPQWLQDAEWGGDLVIQFDESFAPMNLGDCGIMYVFRDTAFMQCH